MHERKYEETFAPPAELDGCVAFSIDVEDYFMSPESIPFEAWPSFHSRIEEGMKNCLSLLRECDAKATFFFVGWLAERYPQLVEWTLNDGHEIGTHTYTHHFVNTLSHDQFAESLGKSLEILRAQAGSDAVIGHRAPAFSLSRDKPWQFECLKRNGIVYDSSINPHGTYLYGDSNAPRHPYQLHGLVELPPSTIRCMGRVWPIGGGGTLRILPHVYQAWARERYRREGWVPVVYMHPWEFLDDHPPLRLPLKQRIIHFYGLNSVRPKLRSLLGRYRGVPMRTYYASLICA